MSQRIFRPTATAAATSLRPYWDNKHPTAPILYEGRPLPGSSRPWTIDVRHFIWGPGDSALAAICGAADGFMAEARAAAEAGDFDTAVWNVQRFVFRVIRYRGDEMFGASEFWLFPAETLALRAGDCEDGALVIATLCRQIGVPAWRIRVAAGMVDPGQGAAEGGHAWVCYLREAQDWEALDWCYFQDSDVPVVSKPALATRAEYFGGDRVWFSFNDQNAWSHEVAVKIRGRIATGREAR